MKTTCRARGFTLMELMIAIAIMGIIAAIAIPSYLNYTRRAYFAEIVAATAPYKLGVVHCFQQMGALTDCLGGQHGVPDDLNTPTAGIKSIVVANGVITATPVAKHGLVEADTYVLIPTATGHHLIWASSGGAVDKGLAPATK